jgi:tripartite-type tricarboxylate transporter receptor subunit TctC
LPQFDSLKTKEDNMNRRLMNALLWAAGVTLTLSAPVAMAAWPDGKPVSIVVPYAPGGTADALARLIAQHLGTKLSTSVVVVNKAGASGIIGAQAVAQASPDGFTQHRCRSILICRKCPLTQKKI